MKHALPWPEAACCYANPYQEKGSTINGPQFVCMQNLETNTQMIHIHNMKKQLAVYLQILM